MIGNEVTVGKVHKYAPIQFSLSLSGSVLLFVPTFENTCLVLIKALKHFPRDKVQIASKFGIVSLGPPQMIVKRKSRICPVLLQS